MPSGSLELLAANHVRLPDSRAGVLRVLTYNVAGLPEWLSASNSSRNNRSASHSSTPMPVARCLEPGVDRILYRGSEALSLRATRYYQDHRFADADGQALSDDFAVRSTWSG